MGTGVVYGRRTRSFEMGDCLSTDPATVTVGCALPTTTSLHMHLLHQQGSTSSTDASSTHVRFSFFEDFENSFSDIDWCLKEANLLNLFLIFLFQKL